MEMSLKDWIIQNEQYDQGDMIELFINLLQEVVHEHELGEVCGYLSSDNIYIGQEHQVSIRYCEPKEDEYRAPELFGSDTKTIAGDIYALGIILDELERGITFWESEKETIDQRLQDFLSLQDAGVVPLEETDFEVLIERFTAVDEAQRPITIDEINSLLKENEVIVAYMGEDWVLEQATESEEVLEDEEVAEVNEVNEVNEESYEGVLEEAILESMMGREIGIDLGTCNASVAYMKNGKVQLLKIKNNEITPSAIFFDRPDNRFYGKMAINKGIQYPNALAKLFKRKMGVQKRDIQIQFANKSSVDERDSKVYIFDTNVFLDSPSVLEDVSVKDQIVLSLTVLEELAYKKRTNEDLELHAEKAEEIINRYKGRIRFEDADVTLVPKEFFVQGKTQNDINDNKILSVAMKLKDEKPILVTSDNGMHTKAGIVGIEVQKLKEFEANKVIENSTSSDFIQLNGQEVSAMFLKYLKNEAVKEIGNVTKAVITVPANFNSFEIEATKNAGLDAGFTEVKVEKEPVAAAISYGLDFSEKKTMLVYDFGGGTFDISIIECDQGNFNVLETNGDPKLGGEDLTKELVEYIYEYLEEEKDLVMYDLVESGLSKDSYYYNVKQIYNECEKCKIALSDLHTYELDFECYIEEYKKEVIRIELGRKTFENLIKDKINTTKKKLDEVLNGAGLQANEIDIIILAGGTSSLPCVYEFVSQYFGKQPNADRNPATLIAEGAAILANSEWSNENTIQKKITVFDKTIHDFGVSIKGQLL